MFGSAGSRPGHRPRDQRWTQIDHWIASVHGAFVTRDYDVSDFDDLRFGGSGVTLSGSSHRTFRFSINGGLSFISTASYISLLTDGTAAASDTEGYFHSTASAAARFLFGEILGLRGGYPTYTAPRQNTPLCVFDNPNPITHVRLFAPTGASWNGGAFKLFGR